MRTTVLHRQNGSLTADVTAAATTMYHRTNGTLPTVPFLIIMNPSGSAPEIVLVTAVNSTTNPTSLTVIRAAMGTTAVAWKKDTVFVEAGQKQVINLILTDVSTGQTAYHPMPKGFVLRVSTVLEGAITGADATITIKKNTTSLGTITVACVGSAAGDWDELVADGVAIADFYFDGVDDFLHVQTDGGSTGAKELAVMVEYIPY